MVDFKINKEEYKQFLNWKLSNAEEQKRVIELEILELKERIANNFSELEKEYTKEDGFSGSENVVKNTRNSVGWKYKVRDVLAGESDRLTSSEIVQRVCSRFPEFNQEVAVKSIGSALSTNSRNADSMFIKETVNGVFYYRNNPNYKE